MKKIILALLALALLTGCSTTNKKPTKLTDTHLDKMPKDKQIFFSNEDYDVVSMDYFIKHKEDYISELGENKFVFITGEIVDINITDYSKEDLSIMSNQDMAELIKNLVSYKIYLYDSDEYLSEDIKNYEPELDIDIGDEYLFFVSVTKHGNNILEMYKLD